MRTAASRVDVRRAGPGDAGVGRLLMTELARLGAQLHSVGIAAWPPDRFGLAE